MHQTVNCPHCGEEVEIAAFCTNCGRPLRGDPAEGAAGMATEPLVVVDAPLSPGIAAATGEEPAPPSPAPAADTPPTSRFLPGLGREDVAGYRGVAYLGLLIVLVALLIDSAGIAIAVGSLIVPVIFLMYLTGLDLYEPEAWPVLAGVVAGGVAVGMVYGVVADWVTDELWLEGATVNAGAAGFGVRFAEREGSPPALMLLLGGLFLPALAQGLIIGGPLLLRRWRSFRNEAMDGVILGAAAGSGFAAAGAIVYYWPLIRHDDNPGGTLADWTATLLGLTVTRPLILGTTGALVGAGIWHYALRPRPNDLLFPLAAGLGGAIVFAVGDLLIQPAGARPELLWHVIVLAGLGFALRIALNRALALDRRALMGSVERTVCPSCRRVTPVGAFCVACGKPLPGGSPERDEVNEPPAGAQTGVAESTATAP